MHDIIMSYLMPKYIMIQGLLPALEHTLAEALLQSYWTMLDALELSQNLLIVHMILILQTVHTVRMLEQYATQYYVSDYVTIV